MLVHNGDMDATGGFTIENEDRVEAQELGTSEGVDEGDANPLKKAIIEGGGMFCMNRRQTWTALVYLVRFLCILLVFLDCTLSILHCFESEN
jgi:hypothetical protein